MPSLQKVKETNSRIFQSRIFRGCWLIFLSSNRSFIISIFWGTSLSNIVNTSIPFNYYTCFKILDLCKISILYGALVPLYYYVLFTEFSALIFTGLILCFSL